MTCQPHPPWLDHSNYTWRRAQVMKLRYVHVFISSFVSIFPFLVCLLLMPVIRCLVLLFSIKWGSVDVASSHQKTRA
jgi:hypothetical protein